MPLRFEEIIGIIEREQGFVFAHQNHFLLNFVAMDWGQYVPTLLCLSFSSSYVYFSYIDRYSGESMEKTINMSDYLKWKENVQNLNNV